MKVVKVYEINTKQHNINKDLLRGNWKKGRYVNLYKKGKKVYTEFPCPSPDTAIDYAEAGYHVEFCDGLQML